MEPRLVLVWRATERCDTACGFCAFDVTLRRPRRQLEAPEALRFGSLVAWWAARRGRAVLLSWLGGEPSLWAPLREVSSRLRAEGLGIGLTTNGRAVAGPDWQRWAVETLEEVTFSLDGPPRLHDRLRRRPGLGHTVLEAIEGLSRLRRGSRRPLLRVNAVLMRETVDTLPALLGAVAEAGADEVTFNALGGADRPEFFPDHRLRADDIVALGARLPRLRAAARERGLAVRGGDRYLERLLATVEGEPLRVDDCGPGQTFWFVEVDGTLAPCSFTAPEYGIPIARLRRPEDLDALPRRLAAARVNRPSRWCADCPSTQVHAKFAEPESCPSLA